MQIFSIILFTFPNNPGKDVRSFRSCLFSATSNHVENHCGFFSKIIYKITGCMFYPMQIFYNYVPFFSKVLQSIRNQDSKSEEKVRQIRNDYEKKIGNLQGELKKMQAAKKEHARLLRQKAQNEQQLRTFQNELSELKKTKVRLMKQMKEESAKNKQQEAQRNKQIAQLKKESRLRQMTIKNLEMEKRQRDVVLKRKQEEVRILHFLLETAFI